MEAQAERRRARAQLRLLHDLRVLREEPLEAAEPLDDSCFTWHANLELDGELLHFEIIVPSTYPSEAPSVFFPTGLPHPNCFPQRAPDGRASYFVCLDMLGNTGTTDEVGSGWSSAYDLRGLLAQLQAFVLDSRNQYHRAGGLTKHNALAAARRYCCPHCPHRPKRPYPLPRPAERRQRLTLLKSLAPPRTDRRQQQEDRRSAEAAPPPPICRVTVEPRPWRDVQRLATHVCCMAAPQAAQAACPSAMKGWQEPGKGRVLRSKHAAQMSADMQRHVAAVQIQAMVRMCLARALAMCLRRLQVPGAMPSSLKAAQAESVRLGESATALSLRLSQAQAAEVTVRAEEKARGTLQERALMAAFESLARKRRNLQKRLRQISELASMSAPLSEEQQAKVARRKDTEHALQKMDRRVGVPPCALTSAELSAEARRDAETAGFHELFSEALQAEREVSVKLKSKLRKERRFAKLAAEPMVSRASQWALHMDLARSAFVEIRAMGRLADVYSELGKVFCEWRAAAVGVRMRSAGKQKANRRRPECLGSKDGVCHWAKVSYTLQIGVILPMMTYKELLLLATVSRGLRASAEDGCLWSVQMSRYYPLSALTPASMKDWKYAFQCELNQAIASLECFHTKQHALDDNAVIGIPIEFTINPKTEKTDYIYSSMDFLSHEAFAFDSVRKTVYKEDFTHWLPLYFSEVHWARSLPLLPRALVQLLPHRRGGFQPDMAIEVFSKMINTLVVLICDKGIAFSDRAAKAYCLLHRWALRCMQEWPELRRYVDGRIDSFCRGQQHRSKEQEPNLGEFMALLLLSSRPWARVAPHVLEEMMDREVLWLCTEHPCLANVAGATAPSDEQRLELSWKAKLVGKRLYAFHVSCFTMFKDARGADEVALDYDRFYGQPSQSLLNQFRRNTQTILDMSDWGTFFQLVRVKAPAPQRLAEMLRQSVKNSRKRGYHRDGMDFNRADDLRPMSKITLRFHDRGVEAAYKAKLEKELFKPTLISCTFVPVILSVLALSTYSVEAKRPELPFLWGTDDPRTMYFATHLAIVLLLLLMACLFTIRLISGKLDSLNWEFLSALPWACMVSSLFMMSAWHTAMLFGKVPEEAWIESSPDSEFLTLLETIGIVVSASVYLPIRTSILWLVPMCAVGSYITMVSLIGSPFPASISRNIVYLVLLSFFSYQGARRREKDDREKWYSVQMMSNETVELKDVKQAYQQVASAFCEIVVKLGSNECVEDSDTTHTAFFGRCMEGQPFSEVLDSGEREAFSELLQQASASQVLQSMPATLDLNFNSAKVQLIVVDTNVTHARQHSWLVGVHSVEMNHPTVSEISSSMMSCLNSDRLQVGHRDVDQETRWESLPTTTDTGRVFQDIDREDPGSFEGGVQQRLESIAEMGSREHWLISPSDMELLPKKILGSGGFGVVVAGRLRGTPVAVKLPKWSVPGRQLPTLASISNELRLHRHIRHPNIVLWHGSCIDPQSGHLSLVYELVSGIQLDEYVHEDLSDLPGLQARHKLLVDMACALLYLHSHNPTIVHGDLKTSNILVERWASGPRAKLLDFGLSQLMTKRAAPLGGTLHWMAPELLVNSRYTGRCVAASADVFSFGRLAYFVCAGLNPLAGFQHTLILQMARQRRPVPLRWTNGTPFLDKCRGLCDVCLSHEPSARPSMAAVRTSLASWLPMPNDGGCKGLDEVYRWVTSSKGASWCNGLKSLEDATGAELSSYTLSVGARDRGEMHLDALEALIEGSPSGSGDLDQTNPSNPDILGHGEPEVSETCSDGPCTIHDNRPAALPEHTASVSL